MKNVTRTLYEYAAVAVGTFILAAALSLFLAPHNLVTGGVTGLAIAVNGISENTTGVSVPIWLTNMLVNIPLLLLGWKVRGLKFIARTLYATVLLSAFLYVTDLSLVYFSDVLNSMDMFLCSVFGGALCGVGVGIVLRFNATTGGSDLAAGIIHKFFPHVSLAKFMTLIDAVIITLGFFVFGAEKTLYALVAVFVTLKTVDAILEGLSFSKAAFIIADNTDLILDAILKDMERSATLLNGTGAYTKTSKNVILCVVSKKEIVTLKDIVMKADKNSFVIVADVREVLGEGFHEYSGN